MKYKDYRRNVTMSGFAEKNREKWGTSLYDLPVNKNTCALMHSPKSLSVTHVSACTVFTLL